MPRRFNRMTSMSIAISMALIALTANREISLDRLAVVSSGIKRVLRMVKSKNLTKSLRTILRHTISMVKTLKTLNSMKKKKETTRRPPEEAIIRDMTPRLVLNLEAKVPERDMRKMKKVVKVAALIRISLLVREEAQDQKEDMADLRKIIPVSMKVMRMMSTIISSFIESLLV